MNRYVEARMKKLEALHLPSVLQKYHYIVSQTADECEAQRREMIEFGAAEESDDFIFVCGAAAHAAS